MRKILLILLFIITGCSKYTELNELAIIKSIGIEKRDNYTLYLKIIDEVQKDSIPKTKVIKTNGNTIQELFDNIKNIVNKNVYLSHIDLLILDENLNNLDYHKIINYFINNHNLRNDFYTITSNDINNLLNNTKYDEIEELINNNKDIIKISFEEIIIKYFDNNDFILSKIIYDNELKYVNNIKIERNNNAENRT